MTHAQLTDSIPLLTSKTHFAWFIVFIMGLLGPLGFSPFHMPGVTLLSIAFLFSSLLNKTPKNAFFLGCIFGFGYFGFGVSWVIISIHDYGQIHYLLAFLITLLFVAYLSLFVGLVGFGFSHLQRLHYHKRNVLLFACLWALSEVLRASLFGGFPWLFIGTSLIDTPMRTLAPIVGIYGLSFLGVFAAGLLALALREKEIKRSIYLIFFVVMMMVPSLLKTIEWTKINPKPITIGAVQANLSMRDKWDDKLFWDLLKFYERATNKLLGKDLIILPESAIPLPASYLNDYLSELHTKALQAKSALILGILQPTNEEESNFYNTAISLGQAQGKHIKHQLVPFGEYIPQVFVRINQWLNLPMPNILPGPAQQDLIKIANKPIANLICYEMAYPHLLRLQLPLARWIVSISDNGWFGHSLASYQQLQMAQMLSLLTGRFQILVNNDGLSSVINHHGDIVESLPPFSSGILQGAIYAAEGATPWVVWADIPVILFCSFIFILMLFFHLRRRSMK